MSGLQEVRNPIKSVVVDQNGAKQCLFRFNIVGCLTIKRIFCSRASSSLRTAASAMILWSCL